MVLGFVIGQFGELNALIPGMMVSVLIFAFGFTAHRFGSTRALSRKSLGYNIRRRSTSAILLFDLIKADSEDRYAAQNG